MSHAGIPFDTCLVEDAENVINNYKCAIFTAPIPTENGKKAIEVYKRHSVPFISSTEEKPYYDIDELRAFSDSSGVHCYNNNGDIFYCGNGFIGIHIVNDGETKITLPRKYKIRTLHEQKNIEIETDTIIVTGTKHSTRLFEIID